MRRRRRRPGRGRDVGGSGGLRDIGRAGHRLFAGLPDSSARADGWPAEAPPEPGGRVGAVHLAVGPSGDPELAAATAYLAERGYSAREQELGCDVEAADALRRDRQERAVAVYFAWRDEAADFLTRLKPVGSHEKGRAFVEMLPVTRGCFD